MRITTWNCLGDLKRKLPALHLLQNPDIAIIQECSRSSIDSLDGTGYSGSWMGGTYEAKGHAVLWKSGWGVHLRPGAVSAEEHENWVVAFEVSGPDRFTLVAVWAKSEDRSVGGYVKQIRKAFDAHPEWFAGDEVIVAGDFNSGFHWDKQLAPANHSSLVTFLEERGLISAYHSQFEDGGSANESPTFHFGKDVTQPFHIDYIFFPKKWLDRKKSVRLGCHADWSLLSDHCPLTLELSETA